MSFDIICFLFNCCFIIGKVFSSKALSEVGYIFNGCYQDSALNPDMSAYSSVIATPEPDLCCRKCQKLGRPYCGLQKSTYCFCGEDYGDYGLSTECTNNPSCQSLVCGGSSSNSIYYSIGILNNFQLDKSVFMKDGLTFQNARQKCMLMNGDIMSPVDDARTAAMLEAASASLPKVWVGLFRMKTGQTYQWTEELMKLSYAAKQIDYYTKWKAGDDRSGNCVVMDTSTSKWESVDCGAAVYPFMCAIYASASTGNQSKLNDSSQFDGASVTFAPDDNASVNKVMLYVLLPIFLMCYVSSCIAYCAYKLWLNCARKPLLEKIEALKYENEYSDKDPIIEAPSSNIAGIHKNANMEAMIAKTKMPSDPPLRSRIAENNKNEPVAANSQVTTSGSTNPSSSASGNGSMTANSDEAGMKTSINEILMNKLKARAKAQEKN